MSGSGSEPMTGSCADRKASDAAMDIACAREPMKHAFDVSLLLALRLPSSPIGCFASKGFAFDVSIESLQPLHARPSAKKESNQHMTSYKKGCTLSPDRSRAVVLVRARPEE